MMPAMRAFLLLLLIASPTLAAERLRADLACRPVANDELAYDCAITLSDAQGKPVAGAEITVGADMPSMPMAHNVAPVQAKPATEPGTYDARLELEMHGEWAVKLRLAKPRNDQFVRRLRFEPGKVEPATRR